MHSEQQWQQFSTDSDEKLLDMQTLRLGDIRSAPVAADGWQDLLAKGQTQP